jgi:hypothetical protein
MCFALNLVGINAIKYLMRRTWKDILSEYPNEHVVIAAPSFSSDSPATIEEGEVIDHDPELDILLNRCDLSKYDSCAVTYTGNLGEIIGERGMVRVIEHD